MLHRIKGYQQLQRHLSHDIIWRIHWRKVNATRSGYVGYAPSYAPRYIRYATRHMLLKPEIRTRYVPHYLLRYTSLPYIVARFVTHLVTHSRRLQVVCRPASRCCRAEKRRREAQRGAESAEVHIDPQRALGGSESVRERQRAAWLRAIADGKAPVWQQYAAFAVCRSAAGLSSSEISILCWQLTHDEPCYVLHYSTRKRLRV